MDRRPPLSHIQPPDVYLTPRCAWTGNHQPYLCPNGGLNVDPCGGEGGSGGVVLPISRQKGGAGTGKRADSSKSRSLTLFSSTFVFAPRRDWLPELPPPPRRRPVWRLGPVGAL